MANFEEQKREEFLPIIARYFEGIANDEEKALLSDWIGSSEENRSFFDQVRLLWDTSDRKTFQKVTGTSEAYEKLTARIPALKPKKALWYYWQQIAAILIIPLIISTVALISIRAPKSIDSVSKEPVYNEVFAAIGTRSSLRLEDSTLVWLNSGSSIRYPMKFTGKIRQVFLNGEAYFEVKSDEKHPFIVKTNGLEVRAKGTKFNVLDFEANQYTEVTLVSGKVVVEKTGGNATASQIAELKPEQHLAYDKKTELSDLTHEDVYKYYAWKDGKMVFRNQPLSEVVRKIGQTFNVDIEIRDNELQNFRYRATFQDESLEEVLKLLKLSSPVDFLEVKRNPLPDGSFQKKKVIIFPVNK
jgi:transmembrane sensor